MNLEYQFFLEHGVDGRRYQQ